MMILSHADLIIVSMTFYDFLNVFIGWIFFFCSHDRDLPSDLVGHPLADMCLDWCASSTGISQSAGVQLRMKMY